MGAIWCSAGAEAWDEQDTDSVKCWGRNTYGQLGDGTTTNPYTPVEPTKRRLGSCNTQCLPVAAPFLCNLVADVGFGGAAGQRSGPQRVFWGDHGDLFGHEFRVRPDGKGR